MKRIVVLALLLAGCGAATAETTTTTRPDPTSTSTTPPTTTTTIPVARGEWALLSPDGLVKSEEGQVLPEGPAGWESLARDHAGGLAFISGGALWWLPAGESEPHEVGPAEGDLIEVVPTSDGGVARIGLCDPVYLNLADGSAVEGPVRTAVEVECPEGTVTWHAANGVEATIEGPGVIFDSEGQVAGIEDVAALEIIREGEVVLEIPVGGYYEAYARIHDFDGRFAIVSRGPFEPAMPVETFFVIDLETGEIQHPGEHASASAALLGPDSTTVPALPDVAYVHRGVPLFTDDRMSQLDDGTYLGFVTYTAHEGLTGRPEIHFDLAVWFGGKEAEYAALEDGDESPPPNGYYIRNDDPLELVLPVVPGVDVTSVWYHDPTGSNLQPQPITWDQFVNAMTGEPLEHEANMLNDPWWVTVVDGEVVAIDEQYIP